MGLLVGAVGGKCEFFKLNLMRLWLPSELAVDAEVKGMLLKMAAACEVKIMGVPLIWFGLKIA